MSTELTRDKIAKMVEESQDSLFRKIENQRDKDQMPSDVAKMLDQDNWGLGDSYREWWEQGEGEWL